MAPLAIDVEHGSVQEVNQTLADSFRLDRPEGALVSDVVKGGPADHAGLKAGDVIIKLNGQPSSAQSASMPAVSLARRQEAACAELATSRVSRETSMPMNIASDMFFRSHPCLCELEDS